MPGGQAQTVSYLENTLLASGQATGAITPNRMQDIPASFVPWDDPGNASGLTTPAIVRATVGLYGMIQSGAITAGQGISSALRTANGTALQNAFNYAANNGLIFEGVDQNFEFTLAAGLVIYSSVGNITWRGNGATFWQFYAGGSGAPCCTIGDTTQVNYLASSDISDANFYYGVSQTGLVNSTPLRIQGITQCNIKNLIVGAAGVSTPYNPGYYGLHFPANTSTPGFNNTFDNIMVNGAQVDIWHNEHCGESIYKNLRIMGGGGQGSTPPAITGSALWMAGSSTLKENRYEQVNIEWLSTNNAIKAFNCFGLELAGLHTEGINMTGAGPSLFWTESSVWTIDQWNIETITALTGHTASGTLSIVYSDYAPSVCVALMRNIVFNSTVNNAINIAATLYNTGSYSSGLSTMRLDGLRVNDPAGGNWNALAIDNHMPNSSTAFFPPVVAASYIYRPAGSELRCASINVSSTYTHYGQLVDATITLAATGSYNVDLALTMGASGTQLPPTRSTLQVLRPTYTSGTVTFRNGSGGTTITTNAATTTTPPLTFEFNGTAWVTVTPVT